MKKIYLSLFLSILWTSTLFAADPSETIDGITYTLFNSTNTATVTNTPAGSVSIPATITYNNRVYNVTTISAVNSGVTSVVIAEGVTSIGTAFSRGLTSLTSVQLPSTIQRIEDGAFYNSNYQACTSLISINLPEGLIYIGTNAFKNCTVLPAITIPSTLTSMGNNSFDGCTNLKNIIWNAKQCVDFASASVAPFTTEYQQYKGNGNGYYYYRKNEYTTSITFGDSVQRIPAYLCNCFLGISTLVIPDNVTEIGQYAFNGYVYAYNLFSYDRRLTSVTLGNGLEKIGDCAFYSRQGLMTISIPDKCTEIGASAFAGCSELYSITIGKRMSIIGAYAFRGTIFNTINIYALEPPAIATNVFDGYSDLMAITLNVRSSALADYKAANVWKDMYVQAMENDLRTFTLTVSSEDESKGITTPSGKYDEGDDIVISALAKDGYHFTKWSDGNKDNPRLVKLTGDLTYTAYFAAGSEGSSSINAYTVNINGENCALNISGQYPEGSIVTMEAVPDECLEFQQWSDGNKDNPRTITVADDTDLTAEFSKVRYTITDKSDSNAKGHVEVTTK